MLNPLEFDFPIQYANPDQVTNETAAHDLFAIFFSRLTKQLGLNLDQARTLINLPPHPPMWNPDGTPNPIESPTPYFARLQAWDFCVQTRPIRPALPLEQNARDSRFRWSFLL